MMTYKEAIKEAVILIKKKLKLLEARLIETDLSGDYLHYQSPEKLEKALKTKDLYNIIINCLEKEYKQFDK